MTEQISIDNYLEFDEYNIFYEQKETLNYLFNNVDLEKVAFVGGVADYLNLRKYYQMPINDVDIIFEEEDVLDTLKEKNELVKYQCSFYQNRDVREVLVSNHDINGKKVHVDYFKRNFGSIGMAKSFLLGQPVYHASFEEMKQFHNNQIPKLTSETMREKYEWKRLYKHSRKGSLYNNIVYLKEKKIV